MKKKVVFKLDLNDDKSKLKAMRSVLSLAGADSVEINFMEGKLTVIGDVDPVVILKKLGKFGRNAELLTSGPVKEEKKKEDEKKKINNNNPSVQQVDELNRGYCNYPYYNPPMNQYYHPVSAEECPNACVIS